MIQITDKRDCVGCNACTQRCPKNCITMHRDSQGFLYPEVDLEVCIHCDLCEKVCPVINQAAHQEPLETYAAVNNNSLELQTSSSGGIFVALAKKVIKDGGVVFGARFNDNFEVIHDFCESQEGLPPFQGSKYVQSNIGNAFLKAEEFLKQGRTVFFTGTPCQIAGLNLFLRKDYPNLITADVICHGVPSPLVWKKYLQHVKDSHPNKAKISNINFRDKKQGWENFGLSICTQETAGDVSANIPQNTSSSPVNCSFKSHNDDLYMRLFLSNLDLRPSCHQCPVRSGKSQSCLTLGDFWGVKTVVPQAYNPSGTSLLLANTHSGVATIKSLATSTPPVVTLTPATYSQATSTNSPLVHSPALPKASASFWTLFNTSQDNPFTRIPRFLDSLRPSLLHRILRRLGRLLRL